MKIVHKIILANIFHVLWIALIYFSVYQALDLMLAKLRFIEISDDLNTSFLEMRLSEKNYFLYNDKLALQAIEGKIGESMHSITAMRADIVRAVGAENFDQLKLSLEKYREAVEKVGIQPPGDKRGEADLREAGRNLREFSENISRLERKKIDDMISSSKKGVFYFFCFVLLAAIGVSYLIFSKILRSLKNIENAAQSISEGNFDRVEESLSKDELGSVMRAINSMSEELKNREEQIIQSKKLASLGILTAGVAHELGNPLNNISMIAQAYTILYDSLKKEDRIGYMEKILEETGRIKEIVQNLLDFSKPKKADFREAEINTVVRKTLKLVHNMLHVSAIETKLDLEEDLPKVFIDENKIQEVLVNLITNAVQAMSPGGELMIATRLGEARRYVVIEVRDTGKGIPPEFLPHIFDPFFSTKGVQGTGLGLSVSYSIIKNHKGHLKVKSEVGVGTTFFLELAVQNGKENKDEECENYGGR
jgi:two-component system NtrC family sensor kinase